jgi:hypothetical protein
MWRADFVSKWEDKLASTNTLIFFSFFTVVYGICLKSIMKNDITFGLIYFFLFIYSIFALIGYSSYPILSLILGAYFAAEDINRYISFIGLSFLCFFIVFKLFYKRFFCNASYNVSRSGLDLSAIFIFIYLVHLIFLYFYFIFYGGDLSYSNASDESFQAEKGLVFSLFMHLFKLCPTLILLLYFLYVNFKFSGSRVSLNSLKFLTFFEVLIFLIIAIKVGNRTDLLALTMSVIFLEYVRSLTFDDLRTRFAARLKNIVIFGVAMIIFMNYLESFRNIDNPVELHGVEKILMKDYFAPAHILFAAISLNYIDPWNVFISNISNTLFLLKQPYLQYYIMEIIVPGVATRSASYAFYIFTEGFMALGWFGILYNGIIPFLGISLWRFLANSNSKFYNIFVLSLISTQFATVCRGQSSYFIKDVYIFFIPALFLLYCATGLRPASK